MARSGGHVHHWLVDASNHGVCGCGDERDFPLESVDWKRWIFTGVTRPASRDRDWREEETTAEAARCGIR